MYGSEKVKHKLGQWLMFAGWWVDRIVKHLNYWHSMLLLRFRMKRKELT